MTGRRKRSRSALRNAAVLFRASASSFSEHRARRLSAGLAYYAVFALVPALLASVFIAAVLVGREAAAGTISDGLSDAVGRDLAFQVEEAIASTWEATEGSSFTLISLLVVAYTASVLFVAWRDTLELIWDVPYSFGVRTTILKRVYGMLVPILVGLLLAAVIVAQTVVALLSELSRFGLVDATLRVAGTAIPAVVAVIALAGLYRYSTRAAKPPFTHVFRGAAVAWIGLAVLSWGFGIYLRVIGTASFAGAASSVFVGLGLLYYGAQVLLFGAEVVRCSAETDRTVDWPGTDPDTAPDDRRSDRI